jgi:hypothetical protein
MTSEVKNDTLCPGRIFVLLPVIFDGSEGSSINGGDPVVTTPWVIVVQARGRKYLPESHLAGLNTLVRTLVMSASASFQDSSEKINESMEKPDTIACIRR